LPQEGVSGYAVFGERVGMDTVLDDGDRLELLQPLLVDPKEARRRRARH
jgi:putative ubiquitin-RnfH superfamily antitoxin RatB of RatAB toxin-antitoxin module